MTFLAGLGLGLSLIVAIGAQNVYVLRQGLRKERVGLVVAICALSDAVLIIAGVAGLGALVALAPWWVTAARWAGAAFLVGYGLLAAKRALWPAGEGLEVSRPGAGGARSIALTTLALTWLNPHVYLDTVFLLGSVASTHGDARWLFASGAVLGSFVWFTTLGFGARYLSRILARPGAWRVLDGAIAVVMVVIAVGLVLGA